MKKITSLLIVMLLFLSVFIMPNFTLNAVAITQHEVSDGTTYGVINANTIFISNTSYEKYITGDDDGASSYYDRWTGQSFTIGNVGTNVSQYITSVRLKLYKTGNPGAVTVSIRATELSGGPPPNVPIPTGSDLTTGTTNGDTLTTDTAGEWRNITLTHYALTKGVTYAICIRAVSGDTDNRVYWRCNSTSSGYAGGHIHLSTDSGSTWSYYDTIDAIFELYGTPMSFDVIRVTGISTERNNFSFIPSYNWSGNVTLRVPVSTSVMGILDVTNNTCGSTATEVDTSDELVNNTFWFDSANDFVHIRTVNLTTSSTVNWTVNCSYGATFTLQVPQYLNAGDYFMAMGLIKNSSGDPISGLMAKTRILYANGNDAITPVEWNCTSGNYYCVLSTTAILPGTYGVSIEFTDPSSGVIFKEGSTLYLSTTPGSGIYVSSYLHFTFYNNNTGLGLNSELFKIYASEDTTIDSSDRIYVDMYNTYTGQTIYYRIDDYFDNQIYPTSGSYDTVSITDIEQFEDVPIDWYSFSVKNMNHSIVRFKMTNGSRTYSQYLYPYEPFYWNVLNGTYTINLTYYNPETDAIVDYHQENITITDDTYYWIRGYDLQDIIIEVTNTNTTIMDQIVNIGVNINNDGCDIINQTVNLAYYLSNTESNITNQINLVWQSVNNTKTTVTNQVNNVWQTVNNTNSTVVNQANSVHQSITNTESNITTQLNSMWQDVNNTDTNVENQANLVIQNITNFRDNITTQVNGVWQDVNNSNSTIHTQLNTVITDVSNVNSTVVTQVNYVRQDISNTEGNITTQVNSVWQDINNSNSTIHTQINSVIQDIDNANSTIHTQITNTHQMITNTESNITTQINGVSTSITNTETNITNQITITNTTITNANTSIHTQINSVSTQVTNTETNITNQLNDIDVHITNINTSITDQINSVDVHITNANSTIHSQLNSIISQITNSNTSIIDQINLIWNEVNNTNSTINTQITGVNTKITNFWTDVNNSFTVIQTDISNVNTTIVNLINETNQTLYLKLVNVLDNVSAGGVSVMDRTLDVLDNLTDVDIDLDSIQENVSDIFDNISGVNLTLIGNFTDVFNNLTNILENISLVNVSLGNLINVSIGNLTDVTLDFWGDINSTLKNRSIVMFSFFNTNQGLGLPWESLQIYINGTRLTDYIYYCDNGSVINVTIKDFYNFTLYNNTFTISAPFSFIDLGLTFHSWLFGNKNDDYYMISLLKENATRWWERGIVPYGEREYLIPSGNYTMRIYDADYNELHNSTYTINNSRVYVIHGTNLSEIISGQSVIRGQLLELRGDFDLALTPDIVTISYNPPMIFSVFDKEGMAIGNGIYKICPALIVIATTRNATYSNWINSTPLIPSNGTTTNGTITILQDTLYFAGSGISWVNITYTDNGTLMQNTSYMPNKVDLYGQNVTINASGNIHVRRETKYNQVKKFYWTYYASSGYGPEPSRAGYHTTGIEVINPMNTSLYDVYVYIEFSNQSNPDMNSVVMSDVDNDGVILKRGENYDVTGSGIHFYLLSINASDTREFTLGYYKASSESYTYDEAQVTIPTYDKTMWDEKSYNHFIVNWINNGDTIFRGALYCNLDFNIPTGIKTGSMRVWDSDNNVELSSSTFIYGNGFLRIGANAVNDVNPGGGRSFDVYFLMDKYPGNHPTAMHLNTPVVTFHGFPITPFLGIFIVGLGLMSFGVYDYAYKRSSKSRWKVAIALGLLIIVVFYIFAAKGL